MYRVSGQRMNHPGRLAHRQHGYTLIELIAVLVILGVLSAYLAPRFIGNTTFDNRRYADELAAAIRSTQAIARSSGCAASLRVQASGYAVQQRGTLPGASSLAAPCRTTGSWSNTVWREDGSAFSGTRPAGVSQSPLTRLVFDAQGRPTMVVPSLTVGSFTITIDAGSGAVNVT